MTQVTQLDFSGHTTFYGGDVHKKNRSVNIHDGKFEWDDFSQDTDAVILYQHLVRKFRGAHFKVSYEAGFRGVSAQRWLQQQQRIFIKYCIALWLF